MRAASVYIHINKSYSIWTLITMAGFIVYEDHTLRHLITDINNRPVNPPISECVYELSFEPIIKLVEFAGSWSAAHYK